MYNYRKAIGAIVATSLLLIVTIFAVISFQSWYQTYFSSLIVQNENNMEKISGTNIEVLIGNQLYFKNNLNENISINQIMIGNVECNISLNISPGMNNISLGSCIENLKLDSEIEEVIIITDNSIYSKNILFKNVTINSNDIVVDESLSVSYVSALEGVQYNIDSILINVSADDVISSCSLNFNGTIYTGFTVKNDSCWINQTIDSQGVYYYNVTVVGNNSVVNTTITKILDSQVQCIAGNQVFSYTGSNQIFTVPKGCYDYSIKMWGAGGGGAPNAISPGYGGAGGFTTANLTIDNTVKNMTIIVGGQGVVVANWYSCPGNLGGFGGGGDGGSHDYSNGACGSSGGGRSAVRINDEEIITAGGGGGNGGYYGYGGAGGGSVGEDGSGGYRTNGYGGNQTSGGIAGTVATGTAAGAGIQFQGGRGGDYDTTSSGASSGGGGGGGYFGGGGGSQDSEGGGGSGYCGGNYVTSCTTTVGTTFTPPNTADSDYVSGIAVGGSYQTNGGNGLIIISWS